MAIAGAAAGAARGLEEIVAQRILQQKLEQEIAERDRQFKLEQARLNETIRNNDYDRDRQGRMDAAAETERGEKRDTAKLIQRGRSNMAGVVGMGLDPETAKREIAFSALNSGADVPSGVMEAITPPKVQKYAVTVPGANGRPTRRLATEDELAEGVEEYREPPAPQRPERDPIADHEAKLKLDQKYKTGPAAGPGKMPAAMADKVAAAQTSLAALDKLESLYKDEYVGPVAGRFNAADSKMPIIPGQAPEGFDEFSAESATLKNQVIQAITGAAVGVQEAGRILDQIPTDNDPGPRWKAKAKATRRNLNELMANQIRMGQGAQGPVTDGTTVSVTPPESGAPALIWDGKKFVKPGGM